MKYKTVFDKKRVSQVRELVRNGFHPPNVYVFIDHSYIYNIYIHYYLHALLTTMFMSKLLPRFLPDCLVDDLSIY